MEFFRHCPGCGKRFHIKLEKKALISVDREPMPRLEHGVIERHTDSQAPIPVLVHDERPIVVDIEEFRYTYKCKQCGHEWSEKHVEEHRED